MPKNEALKWNKAVVRIDYAGKTYEAPVEDNLLMRTMSTAEIKQFLNEVSGKAVYWGSFKIDLEIAMEELQEEFDEWYQALYTPVDDEYPKKTETWKKAKIMLENKSEARDWNVRMRELRFAIKRVGVLLKGYDATVWTVGEISRVTTAEINRIGKGGP